MEHCTFAMLSLEENRENLLRLEAAICKHMQSLEDPSHDFAHVQRVRDGALKIAAQIQEEVDVQVVELAALCHDIGDAKYEQSTTAAHLLLASGYSHEMAERVQSIVDGVSFRHELKTIETCGYEHVLQNTCIELAIVQDADRLDAIGAIGIARCFAFSGKRNLACAVHPTLPPVSAAPPGKSTPKGMPRLLAIFTKSW